MPNNPDFARVVEGDPPRQYAYLLKAGDVTVAASDSRAKLEELEANLNLAFRQELDKRVKELKRVELEYQQAKALGLLTKWRLEDYDKRRAEALGMEAIRSRQAKGG